MDEENKLYYFAFGDNTDLNQYLISYLQDFKKVNVSKHLLDGDKSSGDLLAKIYKDVKAVLYDKTYKFILLPDCSSEESILSELNVTLLPDDIIHFKDLDNQNS